MYVAWRRQKLTYMYSPDWQRQYDRWQLSASLNKSVRVEGKPRRLQVSYLGHIEEARVGHHADRAVFWHHAGTALAALDLDPDEHETLRTKLLERVPDPDQTELAARDEFMDLIVQDVDAAAFWCRSVLDDELRTEYWRIVQYVQKHRAAHARYEQWWGGMSQQSERRHRHQLDAHAATHDIAAKPTEPFDYSQLDPETRQAVQEATAAIHDLRK